MKINLKYGKTVESFSLPEFADILEAKSPTYTVARSQFFNSIRKYFSKSTDFSNIGIIVSDKTRLCGYSDYLPWLLEVLHKEGARKENITFYIAYGTHPKQTEDESLNSYGPLYNEYKFIHHNGNDEQIFKHIGQTKRGTPVRIRHDILECSLIITFGAISHHYFAGFGGGRKLFFPGLALQKDIYHNHGLFLDRKNRRLADGCQAGKLDRNPLAEDLFEIETYLPKRISIHGILNPCGKVSKLLVGDTYKDFLNACNEHDKYYKSGINKSYDLVIASAGGYPKDINFIQAHKSVHNAAAFVKDGGRLVILNQCVDGIASDTFLKYFKTGSFENAFEILEKNYEGNGGTALAMMAKTQRIKIYMQTDMSDEICSLLNVSKIDSSGIQKMIDSASDSIAVIHNASLLIK